VSTQPAIAWRPIERRQAVVWMIEGLLTVALLAVALGSAGWLWASNGDGPPGWLVLVSVAAGVAAVAGVVWHAYAAQRRFRFALGDDAVEIEHGVLWRTRSGVPFTRVQHVDLNAGPIERMVGLATLTLHTASSSSDATIPGLAAHDAEAIRRAILTRAGQDDV
jgi:uncharacterized protein